MSILGHLVLLTGISKLPSNDIIPLVEFQREISMTLDPFCIVY
jgi:hypothetical protein